MRVYKKLVQVFCNREIFIFFTCIQKNKYRAQEPKPSGYYMVVMEDGMRSVWGEYYQWRGQYKKLWRWVLIIVHFVQYCVVELPTTN